jgi:DNA repair protein RadC
MKLIKEFKKEQPMNSPESVVKILKEFKEKDKEFFVVLGVDTKNFIKFREIVSIGTLDSALVHPREIFKKAIINSCKAIILSHNHPSGDPTPSIEDDILTKRLEDVGDIIGIPILDHIILGKEEHYSYNSENKLKQGKSD